jgi:hypothetical protein
MAARTYTVACDRHGPMEWDETRPGWKCRDTGCPAQLSAEDVFRLVAEAPGYDEPVALVVT